MLNWNRFFVSIIELVAAIFGREANGLMPVDDRNSDDEEGEEKRAGKAAISFWSISRRRSNLSISL